MTASADTKSDELSGAVVSRSSLPVRVHAWVSLLFFYAGIVILLAAFAGLAWPDRFSGTSLAEYVAFGRSMPIALNTLVFGWITLGLLASLYATVPALVGTPLAFPIPAYLAAALVAGGVGSGVAAIGTGQGAGGRLLEMPWYSDLLLLFGFLVAAVVISTTVARSGSQRLGVPVWYAIAAPWWLFLGYATGAVPGLLGVEAELQSAFSSTVVFGMWIAPAAIGMGYALIARLVPDAHFHPRLGRIGFWSLGALWGWTAARTLQYGPTADWMETIPVLFAAGTIVAVLAIVTDFATALRGSFDRVASSTSLRLFALGTAFFLLVPGHMLLQSFRSTSAVVRFTAWETAFDMLTVVGAFTLWTAALVGQVIVPTVGRRFAGRLAGWSMLLGALFAIGTRWVAGLQQGYTWIGGAEDAGYPNFGDGFANTVEVLHGTDVLTFIGLAVFAAGALVFLIGVAIPRGVLPRRRAAVVAAEPAELSDYEWPDHEKAATVRRGAAAVFAIALLSVVVMPALDTGTEATLLADTTRDLADGSAAARGREVYVAEGCWYCHTQQVRAIVTDLGLGPVSVAGDYVYDPAGILGLTRIGPDLAHAGGRAPTSDAVWVAAHLADPRAERSWSTMPAYDYLAPGDLDALAAYIAGLE